MNSDIHQGEDRRSALSEQAKSVGPSPDASPGWATKCLLPNSPRPRDADRLARETGATPVTVTEAARSRDVVIVTIPQTNIPKLPADLFAGVPDSVVVVDTGNYYPQQRDGRIEGIEAGRDREVGGFAQRLGRPVVKAFNNIYAQHLLDLGRPAGAPGRIALPIAGDVEAAKAVVLRLLDELGFDGVDAGGLDESWPSTTRQSLFTPRTSTRQV